MKKDFEIIKEETFAPILYIMEYEDFQDAIEIHNSVPQGLSSSIFTNSIINSDVYFISKIPAKIMINDVVVVSLFSLFISFLATIYPSYKASKTEPAIILKGN